MTQHDENLIELVGPTSDGWYRTQIPDWIALHPDLKDGAVAATQIRRSRSPHKKVQGTCRQVVYRFPILGGVGERGATDDHHHHHHR